MIAADDDGSFQFAARDEIIYGETKFIAFTVTEPADTRGQTLKLHALLRELDPARERFVMRKHFQDELIGAMNVGRLAGKSGPAEGAASLAKKRTNVGGYEAGEIISVGDAALECESANVVAVVECDGAKFLQIQHAANVRGDGIERAIFIFFGIFFAEFVSLRDGEAVGNVSADGIVRGSLVGEQIGDNSAAREFGNYFGAISNEADGGGFAFAHGIFQNAQGFVEVIDHHIAISGAKAALDAFGIDVNSKICAAI